MLLEVKKKTWSRVYKVVCCKRGSVCYIILLNRFVNHANEILDFT